MLTISAVQRDHGVEDEVAWILLDDPAAAAALAEGPESPAVEPHPENPAYVIFTSGSTGRRRASRSPTSDRQPAGLDAGTRSGSTADDRVLQKTPDRVRRVGVGALLAAAARAPRWWWPGPEGHRDPAYLAPS